jgi:uroporphyrinogen-III synthase
MTLSGKRVVVTRALRQSEELNSLLRAKGAIPLPYPCIAFVPPEDSAPLDKALQSQFDLLLLTSANTVTALAERLSNGNPFSHLRVIAIGTATARAVQSELGLDAEIVSEDFAADKLADFLGDVSGLRIFLPQSDIASPSLAQRLTDAGAHVTAIPAYRTVPGSGGIDLPALLNAGEVDAITFTSPSTVENFVHRLANEGGSRAQLTGVIIACIGPTTAQAAQHHELTVTIVPSEHTAAGLVDALESLQK